MSRIGTCLQCGQRYADIPDSVTATRVKCKVCAGVVEIPPLAVAAPPVTAAPVAAAPVSAAPVTPPPKPVVPARPAGVIPTKPIFAPKAPIKPAVPIARPAIPPARPPVATPPIVKPTPPAPPVARPVAPIARPPAPAVRPAAAAAQPAPPAGRVVAQPAPIVKRAPAAPAPAPKLTAVEILAAAKAKRAAAQAAPAAPAARAAAPAAVMHSGTRRTAREEREHQSYQKPRSNTPLILTVVLLLVGAGAGGLWYMVNQSEEANQPAPAGPTVLATPPAQPAAVPAASSAPAPAQPGAAAPPPAANPQPAADPGAPPETPAAPPAAAFDANYVFVIPEAGKPLPVPTGKVDPAVLTLEKAPPLQRWSKTSDATWTSVQADLALYLDNSGARSNRAGEALVKAGRDAYPAVVTAILQQDYKTVDGVKMAGSLSDLVGKIVGESDFVWRSAERHPIGSAEWTDTVLWQKKAAILRYNRWVQKLREGDSEWEAIAKKGGAGSRKDEEGNVVGDVPPDVPPDQGPPDGR